VGTLWRIAAVPLADVLLCIGLQGEHWHVECRVCDEHEQCVLWRYGVQCQHRELEHGESFVNEWGMLLAIAWMPDDFSKRFECAWLACFGSYC
jgi:hypothetical protein